MNDAANAAIQSVAEHVALLERDFLQLARALESLDESGGRSATLAAYRAIQRVAEAARPVKANCPRCGRPDSKLEYEAVNKLSGVWKLPECPTCAELTQVINAVEKAARSATRSSG